VRAKGGVLKGKQIVKQMLHLLMRQDIARLNSCFASDYSQKVVKEFA
jgi:ketosteroid isomerase-like protein